MSNAKIMPSSEFARYEHIVSFSRKRQNMLCKFLYRNINLTNELIYSRECYLYYGHYLSYEI